MNSIIDCFPECERGGDFFIKNQSNQNIKGIFEGKNIVWCVLILVFIFFDGIEQQQKQTNSM